MTGKIISNRTGEYLLAHAEMESEESMDLLQQADFIRKGESDSAISEHIEEMRRILSGGVPHLPVKEGSVIAKFRSAEDCLTFVDSHPKTYPDVREDPQLPFCAVEEK